MSNLEEFINVLNVLQTMFYKTTVCVAKLQMHVILILTISTINTLEKTKEKFNFIGEIIANQKLMMFVILSVFPIRIIKSVKLTMLAHNAGMSTPLMF